MVRRAVDRATHLLAAMITLVCPLVLCAAEPKVPDPTGEEFTNQGEYVGQVFAQMGESPVGVQVATQGNGKFTASGLLGGLPGDGWDRSPRRGAKGDLKNGAVEIKSDEYTATIQNGVMSISVAGVKISDLKKQDRESATFGTAPPAGAIVLFDGTDASKFDNGKIDEDGFLLPGCVSKENFGSGKLHVEFRVPFMPMAQGQARGNSGVYLAGRYEVQILDSFGDDESDNGCGSIYSVRAPDQNMSYPPFSWQTYDIDFTAPEFKDGKKVEGSQAVMTVRHNGVLVHRKAKLAQPTAGAKLEGEADTGPIYLQDHNCPVRFQNIWFQNAPPKQNDPPKTEEKK